MDPPNIKSIEVMKIQCLNADLESEYTKDEEIHGMIGVLSPLCGIDVLNKKERTRCRK